MTDDVLYSVSAGEMDIKEVPNPKKDLLIKKRIIYDSNEEKDELQEMINKNLASTNLNYQIYIPKNEDPISFLKKLITTKVGRYSMTRSKEAIAICEIINEIISYFNEISPEKKEVDRFIIDCFGGIGGNTLAFMDYFNYVFSYERNPIRYKALLSNAKVMARTINRTGYCKAINADITDVKFIYARPSIIFMDPPWGGKEYNELDYIGLFVGNKDVGIFVKEIFTSGKNIEAVLIKAPVNFFVPSLTMRLTEEFFIYQVNFPTYSIKKDVNPIGYKLFIITKAPFLLGPRYNKNFFLISDHGKFKNRYFTLLNVPYSSVSSPQWKERTYTMRKFNINCESIIIGKMFQKRTSLPHIIFRNGYEYSGEDVNFELQNEKSYFILDMGDKFVILKEPLDKSERSRKSMEYLQIVYDDLFNGSFNMIG